MSNVSITPGVGKDISTDTVAGIEYQRVKLDVGGAGATVPVIGLLPVYSLPAELQAGMFGTIAGRTARVINILGRRSTFQGTTAFQDVCQFLVGGQAAYTEPNVATTYYAVSTSSNDKPGSNGVSKVRLSYLDAAGARQVSEITLNGQTAVSIGSGYDYFQWMESSALGGTLFVAAGDIAISSVNGAATETTTMLMIKAGGNRSMDGKYQVPAGTTAYIIGWDAGAIGQAMDVRLRAEVYADDRSLSEDLYHYQATFYLAAGGRADQDLHYLKLPAGCDIKVSVYPGATTGSPRCDVAVQLLVIEN